MKCNIFFAFKLSPIDLSYMRLFSILSFLLLVVICASAQTNPLVTKDSLAQMNWVEAKYNTMTLDEKFGQLFMVSTTSGRDNASIEKIRGLIKEHHIGGVIFLTGGPTRQAKLTNTFQEASKTPLLIGMDAEWGLAMRLDSTYAFPWNMTLGRILI